MLNCQETTRLISEGLDRRLSPWQRFNLRWHLMLCGACHTYKRQIEGLHRLFQSRSQSGVLTTPPSSADDPLGLSLQRREQIKRLLKADSPGPAH